MKEHGSRDEKLTHALSMMDVPEHQPGFFDRLEVELSKVRRRPLLSRPWLLVTLAGTVAAAAVAVLLEPEPEPDLDVTPAASPVEQVKARTLAAITDTTTLRATVTHRAPDPLTGQLQTSRWSVAATSAGDSRATSLDTPEDLAYDATTGIERGVTTSASMGTGKFYAERAGLAPGPPDAAPPGWILERELGSVTRALAAAADIELTEVTEQNRPAWRLVLAVAPNPVYPDVDRIELTVDKETGYPLHVLRMLNGQFRGELQLTDLAVNAPLDRATFAGPQPPPGEELLRTDEGFRRIKLDQAAVGYAAFVPTWLPNGFRQAETAVAANAAPTATNPPSTQVVSTAYRRGQDTIIITSRRRTPGAWTDPFLTPSGEIDPPEQLRITTGRLAGSTAQTVIGPRTTPHLWVLTDEFVVTISGDVDRTDLTRIAGSLTG